MTDETEKKPDVTIEELHVQLQSLTAIVYAMGVLVEQQAKEIEEMRQMRRLEGLDT